jgi:hypothetical protein
MGNTARRFLGGDATGLDQLSLELFALSLSLYDLFRFD